MAAVMTMHTLIASPKPDRLFSKNTRDTVRAVTANDRNARRSTASVSMLDCPVARTASVKTAPTEINVRGMMAANSRRDQSCQ